MMRKSEYRDEKYIGLIFGCYKILSFVEQRNKQNKLCLYFVVKCIYCGKIKTIECRNVVINKRLKCCSETSLKDLCGLKFGRLTVLKRAENWLLPNGTMKTMWFCKCDCGNTVTVRGNELRSGHTLSCGCYAKEQLSKSHLLDLTNRRFGKLLVLKRDFTQQKPYWICKCDCGKNISISSRKLLSNKHLSCGCLISRAEYELSLFLTKNNIQFMLLFSFDNLKYKRALKFDFAILINNKLLFLVELNGLLHYRPFTFCSENNDKKIENFNKLNYKDNLKIEYCKAHNIPLLIIHCNYFDCKEQLVLDYYNNIKDNNICNIDCSELINKVKRIRKHRIKRSIFLIDIQKRKIVKEWFCTLDIKRELGISDTSVIDCCAKRMKLAGGFAWAYNDDKFDLQETLIYASTNLSSIRRLFLYNLNKLLVRCWFSVTNAATTLKINRRSIYACIQQRLKTYKNFIWSYKLL